MTIKFYDLAGKEDDRRFSPYCWRIRMALAHKGLDVETIAWRFTEKDAIARSNQKAVPVIMDGDDCIHDSWDIACFLDDKYSDAPRLFENEAMKNYSFFVKNWVEGSLFPHLIRILALDIHDHLHEKDKSYFRETRELRFKTSLEKFTCDVEKSINSFNVALTPARATLKSQSFLNGTTAGFADYILFAAFQWARSISPVKLIQTDDVIYDWRERMLDLFDGMPRTSTIGYDL